ncbi:MAG TPA: hypothetical protein VL995_19795 [Cellvibrio sp.]|nr:hypothetical protein [Cellvibrio sp.]
MDSKRFYLKAIVFFATVLISSASQAVYFYKDKHNANLLFSDFQVGKVAEVPGAFNDRVSSVYVPYDKCLIMYEHGHFEGRWLMVEPLFINWGGVHPEPTSYRMYQGDGLIYDLHDISKMDLGLGYFNDKMTSYMIFNTYSLGVPGGGGPYDGQTQGCDVAFLYSNINRGGGRYPVPVDHIQAEIKKFNDVASSVWVPQGACLKVWKDKPPASQQENPTAYYNWYAAPDRVFSPGTHNLHTLNPSLNDRVTGAELVPGNCP